jgi:radical SAM protein with 4Fe4S-binding SPASM domain
VLDYLKGNNIPCDSIINQLESLPLNDVLVSNTMRPYGKYDIYAKLKRPNSKTDFTPQRIDWLISDRCNLSCKHCLQSSSPLLKEKSIDLTVMDRIFTQMDELNVETLKITGGEPLYVNNAKLIFKKMSGRHFEKTVLSNGLLIDDEWIDIFKDKTFHLGHSLDGANEKTHDHIRGKGAFSKLVSNLKKMIKSDIYAAFTITINTCNQNEVEEIANLALNEFFARRIIFNFMRPIGRAQKNEYLYLSNIEMLNVKERLARLESIYKEKILISDDSMLSEKPSTTLYTDSTELTCAAGTTVLAMDNNLDVYPCIYGVGKNHLNMGNLNENSMIDIWQSQRWNLFRGGVSLGEVDECPNCEFISQCTLKQCRLKPLSIGSGFYSHVSYCHASKTKISRKTPAVKNYKLMS